MIHVPYVRHVFTYLPNGVLRPSDYAFSLNTHSSLFYFYNFLGRPVPPHVGLIGCVSILPSVMEIESPMSSLSLIHFTLPLPS